MSSIRTEQETVIKKILPYLSRRGYDITKDLDFETAVQTTENYSKGYVDILVTLNKSQPVFLIEAKRSSKVLSAKDRDQAISYAKALRVLFVVVTNGTNIQCFNTSTKQPLRWNGKASERIPTKAQLPSVISLLKANPNAVDVPVSQDESLPFRPGLPLKQLNTLFSRCHNAIRKIEKDEEYAFADFSKLLFLKLLEEKHDLSDFVLPYSYRFYELAASPETKSDQVKFAVLQMIEQIKKQTTYGDVLEDPIHLKNPKTFFYIVNELSKVSFYDSNLDSKGAAFEYFVRATLKGKKLGQYFTPRPLIAVMSYLVGRRKILNALLMNTDIKVLDPACGTGGFLVYLMQANLALAAEQHEKQQINKSTFDKLTKNIIAKVFFGSDANEGVACAAKMNMIILGDGHTNIRAENSLAKSAQNWNMEVADCDLIMTNPPFGTSEADSSARGELAGYPVASSKGQLLFLQKMVLSAKPGGEICSVIDEGVLNTDTSAALRRWLLQNCRIKAVLRLPDETFKPNKINVRSSVLYMQRLEEPDTDLDARYKVTFCDLQSLGYIGSGDAIRNFDFERLLGEVETTFLDQSIGSPRSGYHWTAFDVDCRDVFTDSANRLDYKYWEPAIRQGIRALQATGASIEALNDIKTSRGNSPPADMYVDEVDGYALVVKAGSNISKFGQLLTEGDYIEKSLYDEFVENSVKRKENLNLIQDGDVLLASTGDGTLGKCCVYRSDKPAIADGHVTVIRVDAARIVPEYLCDYLRCGFGAKQIERLYTGSTGLIELTPAHVAGIMVDLLSGTMEQARVSSTLREQEKLYNATVVQAESELEQARGQFAGLE